MLATPAFPLLLCGRPGDWDPGQLAAVGGPYASTLAVHRLTGEAVSGACMTSTGSLRPARCEADGALLIRSDGHIGYRAAGTDLHGLQRYLAHWLPKATPHPT